MTLRDILACAFRELRRRRWRTSATVLGYVLATAVVVVLVSALASAERDTHAILASTGTHFVTFSPVGGPACAECRAVSPAAGARGDEEGFVVYGQPTRLIPLGVIERARAIPGVKDASPYLLYRFRDRTTGGTLAVGGYDPRSEAAVGTTCCAPSDVVAGRFLRPDEGNGVLLEEAFALSRRLAPGDRIAIEAEELPVVGVINPGIRPGKADVYMHFATAERLVNRRMGLSPLDREANVILVEVRSSLVQERTMRAVKALLPGLVVSSYACYRPAAAVIGMNGTSVIVLTAVVALFAVALALKSQLASVIERRREVAILKAIGWTEGSIVSQILAESTLQALAGGALGALAAAAVLLAVPARILTGTGMSGGPSAVPSTGGIGVPVGVIGAGLLLVLLGGMVAGLLPALLAAREAPAAGLRRI